jgi:hypothetical protein
MTKEKLNKLPLDTLNAYDWLTHFAILRRNRCFSKGSQSDPLPIFQCAFASNSNRKSSAISVHVFAYIADCREVLLNSLSRPCQTGCLVSEQIAQYIEHGVFLFVPVRLGI